ncbi:MAG: EAL domain-containing protein, partial [Candidatus Competibacteraceae bacterium]|nr:EAL domain-containing protein [Candidatus Competibacteraceae bacterium]
HELFLSASIGISLYPRDGTDPQSLLKNADTALYRVKARGGRGFQYYAPAMNSWAVERLRLENDLRYALERQEMVLHYQPQVDVHSGALVGLEALLRWQHPQRGLVPPDSFIPLAEESGIIIALGEWVLRTACAQARHWHEAGLPTFTLAVNISSVQFLQQDFAESVNTILNETRLEPTRLVLEITEGALIQNTTRTHALLQTIKARGVNLAIDDFGTGYSSLTYLKTFPVDILKIDRSFVQDMTADHASAELVFAIIALARALGLRTVAEGVETAEQLALLQTQQCDEVQGYYFSRPLPEAAITALLQENKRFFEVPEH